MSKRTVLKHGQAKIQYYACREKVSQLQNAGYSIQAIYDLLTADGLITMSYKALHRNISKDRGPVAKEPGNQNRLPTVKALPVPSGNPAQVVPVKAGQPSENQAPEWSLDEKLALINAGATQNSSKKRGSGSEAEEYGENEVL